MPQYGNQDYKAYVFEQLSKGSSGQPADDEDHFQHFDNFSKGAPRQGRRGRRRRGVPPPRRSTTRTSSRSSATPPRRCSRNERSEIASDIPLRVAAARGLAPSWLQKLLGLGSSDPSQASADDVAKLNRILAAESPRGLQEGDGRQALPRPLDEQAARRRPSSGSSPASCSIASTTSDAPNPTLHRGDPPMSLIGHAIFGLVAGAIARMLHPGRDPMNWVWTMILGLVGAHRRRLDRRPRRREHQRGPLELGRRRRRGHPPPRGLPRHDRPERRHRRRRRRRPGDRERLQEGRLRRPLEGPPLSPRPDEVRLRPRLPLDRFPGPPRALPDRRRRAGRPLRRALQGGDPPPLAVQDPRDRPRILAGDLRPFRRLPRQRRFRRHGHGSEVPPDGLHPIASLRQPTRAAGSTTPRPGPSSPPPATP